LAWLTRPGLRVFTKTLRAAAVGTFNDGGIATAKSAAYSALLSFFPLLATAATMLVHTRADFAYRQISTFLSQALPPHTQETVFRYFADRGNQPALWPVTGFLVSLWAASGFMVSLIEGFRAAYKIPSGRSFLRERAVAVMLVLLAAAPAVVASVLVLFGRRAEHWAVHKLGLLPSGVDLQGWVRVIGAAARWGIGLAAIAAATAILYFYGPNRKQRWHSVWPGALVATGLWLGATMSFGWYVRNIGNYNVLYGSIATAILLLVWMYLLAIIALFGCEFNAHYEKTGA
jgi:membrane protein